MQCLCYKWKLGSNASNWPICWVLLSPSLSKVCHPPWWQPWIKLDWNHHQSKNKELNCTQSSRQRPTCTWASFYSSGNININLLLVTSYCRIPPAHPWHTLCLQIKDSVWHEVLEYYLSLASGGAALTGDLESESDDLISIFHEMSSGPGARMSSYGTSW